MKPCLVCGEPSPDSRCPDHRVNAQPATLASVRGYDTVWRRLSERARRLQRFCSDCFTTDDLTADHSPEAWRRKQAGKTIRLSDIDVVCRSCNAKRGKARPSTRGDTPNQTTLDYVGEAKSPSLSIQGGHTPGFARTDRRICDFDAKPTAWGEDQGVASIRHDRKNASVADRVGPVVLGDVSVAGCNLERSHGGSVS